ncbi:MAG: hypothetical protein K2X50_05395 [Gammaproteobacteria bacterium]|nr:hypothetical protein [Gammaproteobacteria bacterium]
MSIMNYLRAASIGGWIKDLVIDKSASYTYAINKRLDAKANDLQTLAGAVPLTTLGSETLPESPTLTADEIAEVQEYARPPRIDPDHIWAGAFIETFGFDGFDLPSTKVTYSTGDHDVNVRTEKARFTGNKLSPLLAFIMFLGLPSRVVVVNKEGNPRIDPKQLLRNLFGGWDNPARNQDTRKAAAKKNWWNRAFIPVKIIIAVVHLALWIPKLALNVLKTPFLFFPLVITSYLGKLNGYLAYRTEANWVKPGALNNLAAVFILAPATAIVGLLHNPFRFVPLITRAFFAPEQSARLAWTFGKAIKGHPYIGLIVGTIAVLMSIALSTALWIIAFPVIITLAVKEIPALTPLLNSIAQLPIVASSVTFISGKFALVVGSLPAAFTSAAASLASLVGLTLTAPAVAVGATVAAVSAPTAIIGSRSADELSNSFARWQKGGILAWVYSAFTKINNMIVGSKGKKGYVPLPDNDDNSPRKDGTDKEDGNKGTATNKDAEPEVVSSPEARRRAAELANAKKDAGTSDEEALRKGKTAAETPNSGSKSPEAGKKSTAAEGHEEEDLVSRDSAKGLGKE